QLLHHLDDIVVRMVVVIPENNMVPRLLARRLFARFGFAFLFRLGDGDVRHIGGGFFTAHGPSSTATSPIILAAKVAGHVCTTSIPISKPIATSSRTTCARC